MLVRISHYLTALLFLVALAMIYNHTAVPLIKPPAVDAIAMKRSPMMRVDDTLKDLFAADQWQRGNCKQLQTLQGMLLFENWEQTDNDHWKLWPITVVIGRGLGGSHDDDPVIIEAPSGAELKFTESLDVMSGGAPPIDWGRMIGDVRIYRSSAKNRTTKGDIAGSNGPPALDLRTANVGIDSKKIWTTEAISMTFGKARMVGRDLTIHMAGAAAPGGNAPAVLDRMELIYLDELTMPLRQSRLFPSDRPSPALQKVATDQPAMISVACGGRVEYDFAIDQLLLRESVSLIHQTAGSPADRFDCQQLELVLNDPTNDAIERDSLLDWLIEMTATGESVTAKLPSIDSEIQAEEIKVNARTGLIEAAGRKGIRLRRGQVAMSLASLIYQFDPANPQTIGSLDAAGAGIVRISDPTNAVREIRWRDGLRIHPVDATTPKELDSDVEIFVDGKVHAWLVDGGEFQANNISGLLTPQSDEDHETTLVPKYFKIEQAVRIETSAIRAETDELQLSFVNEPDPIARSIGSASASGGESPRPSPLRQWVSQPSSDTPLVDPVARARPVIRGDTIFAELRQNSAGLSVKDLSVAGNVRVQHTLETGGQSLPATLTGQELRLNEGEDVLQLTSDAITPARFELGDGFFVGPMIQIRPSDNRVWIESAGEFQIPTAALPTGEAGANSGQAGADSGEIAPVQSDARIVWTRPPHCRWQGEMMFDGRKAVLSEGVEIRADMINAGEPWSLHLTGDRLEVDLLDSVQLRDMASMRSATIQKITMMQTQQRPVMLQALHCATDGVLEAKHLVHARQLTLAPADGGRLIGAGPGWYRGWTLGSGPNPFAADSAKSGFEQGLSRDPKMIDGGESDELTGIHLTFEDSLRAEFAIRTLDFLRGVRVGVQSVSGWDQAFDAKQMDAISAGQSTLDCDRLRFSIEPGGRPGSFGPNPPYPHLTHATNSTPWEMEATSGIVFRTRNERGLLEGTASRAAYSSSKDVFIVEGAPNRPSVFRQTLPDGSVGSSIVFRSMSIHPKTMEIDDLVYEQANIAVPPTIGNR